jgi:hypothetical protein
VQGAGGRIDVRSYEGKGSTFAVILPAVMEALGTPTPSPVGKMPAVVAGETAKGSETSNPARSKSEGAGT